MKKLSLLIILLALLSCDHPTKQDHLKTDRKVFPQKQGHKVIPIAKKVIHILPLGSVHTQYINEIISVVKKFYGYDCVVLPPVEPTDDIMAPSRTRFEAGKILNKYNSKYYRLILTERDIAYPNEEKKSPEYGIFGLGVMPGTTCVVSTFRLRKTNGKLVPHAIFIERLDKIVLHEIGHNLGLDHCKNDPHCMMNDAGGTIKQVDQERMWFCDRCRKLLN